MRRCFWFLCGFWLMFSVGISYGADVTLEWKAADNATGYKLYKSLDYGVTWDQGIDCGNTLEYVYKDIPETGLVLFRISTYNKFCEVISYQAVAGYNYLWKPPSRATGLNVKGDEG